MPVTPREEHQEIDEIHFKENLRFLPGYVSKFFISNLVQRTLAHLVGWTGIQSIMLRCTSAGVLKTAEVGTGFEYNDTKRGFTEDTWSADVIFDEKVSRIDIWVFDNAMSFKRANELEVYNDDIELEAGQTYSFDCVTSKIAVKSRDPGLSAKYQIVGWW